MSQVKKFHTVCDTHSPMPNAYQELERKSLHCSHKKKQMIKYVYLFYIEIVNSYIQ